jgi:hypothetical protein
MAELTDKELAFLNKEIDKQGLTYTQLQKELLDHLCCDIEAKMDEGIEFLKAFEEVSKRLENDRIQQIQEETLLLINQKYRMMKKFMYILGTIAPSVLIVGAVFRLQHWPGGSVLITLGTFLLAAVYLPVFAMVSIRDTREKGKKVNKSLYITGVITGFIFLTGILFKIMHWPGAGVALLVSVLLMLVVFIPFLVIHALRDKENQLQNFSILIFILAMMAVNIMVFALKVSKNVLGSMVVTAEENIATSEMIESRNALILESLQLDQARIIAEKAEALDQYIQMIMVDILIATHDDNRAAVAMDNKIDLKKANYFDFHNSTELVIFGNEISKGKGEELQTAIEEYRELLMMNSGAGLDDAIKTLLDTGPPKNDQVSWLGYHFYQTPMISAVNILSNYQLKIRFLEGEVLREIMAE